MVEPIEAQKRKCVVVFLRFVLALLPIIWLADTDVMLDGIVYALA